MISSRFIAVLSIVLVFALIFSVGAVSYAQDAEEISEIAAPEISEIESPEISEIAAPEIWDGSIAESLKGRGTSADPFIISNGAELALATIRETYWGKHFKLTSNIYLNDVEKINWTDGTLKEGAEDYKIREWSSNYSGKSSPITSTPRATMIKVFFATFLILPPLA